MITINIEREFTSEPGARYYSDGSYSGEQFYEELLKDKFIEAQSKDEQLKIIMDGTEGFASSFINEAFSRLGKQFGPDEAWGRLEIVSNEMPKYIDKIKQSIYEGSNQKY
jgi:phosphomannomutase